jgi:hypothetical protein
MKRRAPFIVIAILGTFLVFAGGVRYGQRVEKVNKRIDYLVSLTPPQPTASPQPTPLSVQYKTYSNKLCAVSFLYPSYLKTAKETSQSAVLAQDGAPQLAFSCEPNKPKFTDFGKESNATETAKINPSTGRRIYFKLNPDLLPLLDSSIGFKVR